LPYNIKKLLLNYNADGDWLFNEIRLTYVVDANSGLSIFFRVIGGDIIDNYLTINAIGTSAYFGIDVGLAVNSSSYGSLRNISELSAAKVQFLARMDRDMIES
jgi:hypothetical protein